MFSGDILIPRVRRIMQTMEIEQIDLPDTIILLLSILHQNTINRSWLIGSGFILVKYQFRMIPFCLSMYLLIDYDKQDVIDCITIY